MIFAILAGTSSFANLAEGATQFFANDAFTQNGVEWCEEEKPRYDVIGEPTWLEHHRHSIEARICANLYNDSLWTYDGPDRYEKLIERSRYYVSLEIAESTDEAKTGVVDPTPADDPQTSKIPEWVRQIFVWYAEKKIGEDELIGALQFLIKQGVIKI